MTSALSQALLLVLNCDSPVTSQVFIWLLSSFLKETYLEVCLFSDHTDYAGTVGWARVSISYNPGSAVRRNYLPYSYQSSTETVIKYILRIEVCLSKGKVKYSLPSSVTSHYHRSFQISEYLVNSRKFIHLFHISCCVNSIQLEFILLNSPSVPSTVLSVSTSALHPFVVKFEIPSSSRDTA